MSIEEKKLLTDIIIAITSIDDHLEYQRDFAAYKANKTKRRAVERELEIIGEAVNNLLKIDPQFPIPYAKLIIDLRNKIIHAYDNVNDTIIWKIIMIDIPVLKQEVETLLKDN
jgi:uncharacterized protein with HEPN domain